MNWDVIEVKAVGPLALKVEFADGTKGRVVFKQSHLTGVFAALKDPAIFEQAHIVDGAVTGPGHVDLAPYAMHRGIRSQGEWILR